MISKGFKMTVIVLLIIIGIVMTAQIWWYGPDVSNVLSLLSLMVAIYLVSEDKIVPKMRATGGLELIQKIIIKTQQIADIEVEIAENKRAINKAKVDCPTMTLMSTEFKEEEAVIDRLECEIKELLIKLSKI